jgi:hypothetical protein
MGADLNGVQTAEILILAMVGAVVDGALDALIRGMIHNKILLRERIVAGCRK